MSHCIGVRATLSDQRFLTEAVHLGTQHSSLLLGDLPNANGSVQQEKKDHPTLLLLEILPQLRCLCINNIPEKVDGFP